MNLALESSFVAPAVIGTLTYLPASMQTASLFSTEKNACPSQQVIIFATSLTFLAAARTHALVPISTDSVGRKRTCFYNFFKD